MRLSLTRLGVGLLLLGVSTACSEQPLAPGATAPAVTRRPVPETVPDAPTLAASPTARATPPPRRPAALGSAPPKPVSDRARTTFAGTELEQDALLAQLRQAALLDFKPVGSTSTVFRVGLAASIDMAFKSQTRERPRGPVAEVAAYRVARCLGLDSVPPATLRRVPVEQLRDGLVPDARAGWPEIEQHLRVDAQGSVLGAAIYWVPALHDVGIDTGMGIRQWSEWLTLGGQIPAEARMLMAQLSTMLLFDYLIANWDRFSGGNAKGDAAARVLYLRDHDSAFAPAIQPAVQRRVLDRMLRAERFSRSFYRALRALTQAELEGCLAGESTTEPLLSRAQLDALFDRRETVVSHVASLIELHGADRVLVFP
jgi:hypothetical protein